MKKKLLFIFFLILICKVNVFAQEKRVNRANQNYENYSFSPAIDIYKKVLDKGYTSSDMLMKLGNSYYFNADYKNASEVYKMLVTEYEDEMEPEYYFRYAQSLKSVGNYSESEKMIDKFSELVHDDSINELDKNYLDQIEKNSGRYDIASFQHNSKYSDFAPSFYKEGLIFSSDRDTGNLARYRHTWTNYDFLDLYKINVDSSSNNTVKKLIEDINSRLHESTSVVTKDGNTLYFTRNNIIEGKYIKDNEGFIRLKIFRAVKENGEWAYIEDLPFNNNDYSVAHPTLSPDEKTLYFASDMPGTFGESDIFKVSINKDDTFGTPENLGENINTKYRETFPFVTSEEKLYFSSDGHLGLGGLDIFATKIKRENYYEPIQNVGKPVNSSMDDFTFIFNEELKKGYFASNREGGLGQDDIYSFVENIPLVFECNQSVSGTVRDKITNNVLVGATVKVINEENEEILTAITDSEGNYTLMIDCNQGNFVRASTDGYVPSEEYLGTSDGKPRIMDFYLERETITAGFGDDLAKLLQLSTIYFDLNKFDVRSDAEIEIQKVIAAMDKYPSLKIKVNSHTDSRGKDSYNLWLSQQRAESTMEYMISKGISRNRLDKEGYGETKLINECEDGIRCTREEHQLNRRSEFIILE